MKREGLKKGIYILPNLFTTASLFCGFFAIIRSIKGDFVSAAWAIFLGAIFDSLDGRVARMTRTQSEFGIQYDSLADLVSFGLAPAIMMYLWILQPFKQLGWMAAFLFFTCAALRLARFNVQASNVEKKNFQGLPSPAAAGCQITFVIFHYHMWGAKPLLLASYYVVGMTFALAALMVSQVSYKSLKVVQWNVRTSFFALIIVLGFFALIASEPEIMLFVFAVGYVAVGVIAEIYHSPQKIRDFRNFLVRHFHQKKIEKNTDKSGSQSGNVVTMVRKKDDGK